MRLVTYRSERGERAGVLRDEVVVDAWDALGAGGTSVRELLAGDRLDELAGRIAGAEALALDGVAHCPPVTDPEKISCSGLNYLEPGDVLATGTPFGVGSTRQPRVWLKAGDEVEISSPQLGRLLTRLA